MEDKEIVMEVNAKNKNTKDIDIDTNGLVEVKEYKQADDHLACKVITTIGAIALAISLAFNVNCYLNHRNVEKKPDEEPAIEDPIPTPAPSNGYVNPTGNGTGTNPGTDSNPGTEKKEEIPTEKKEEVPTEKKEEKAAKTPEEIEKAWVTDELPKKETITFDYYDAAEDREDKLTKADKAYIQEYMDYYGISYEDARVSYLEFGPLVVPVDEYYYEDNKVVEYATVYDFDAEDLATINALISELGYTRSEAESVYINEIAPALGKPLKTEIIMLTK